MADFFDNFVILKQNRDDNIKFCVYIIRLFFINWDYDKFYQTVRPVHGGTDEAKVT